MNLATWTDEQLVSARSKLLDWYIARQSHSLAQKLGSIFVAALVLAAATGVYDILKRGLHHIDIALIVPGAVAVYFWHRQDKDRAANLDFLAELNSELVRRGHEL